MSYIENYYKTKEQRQQQCVNFFNEFKEEDTIAQSKKEINRLVKLLEEEQVKCTELMNKRYNADYEPINKKVIIKYEGVNSTSYFDSDTGLVCDEPTDGTAYIYTVGIKNGEIQLVTGYCFPLGGVVKRTYKYTVSTDNKKIRLTLVTESVIPLIESNQIYYIFKDFSGNAEDVQTRTIDASRSRWYRPEKYGLDIDATYFLNKMYGLERETYNGIQLIDVLELSKDSPNFEMLIKTAPEFLMNRLINMKLPKAGTIAKMLEMTEPDYQKALSNGTLEAYIDFKDFLQKNIRDGELEESGLNVKTTPEWLDYLEKCNAWQQDLDFYSVGYDGHLAHTLIKAYLGKDYYYHCDTIYNYYKFGKFCKYVIDETINQGYNNIRNFCSELHDYINMCGDLDVKPTLYSSYLHQTHDITSRNHKIKLEKEQEEIFKKRYEKFKPYKTEKYSIIAPEKALDVQKEGDQMNNCVASYIKRIIDGSCLILFLRYTESLAHSLVTVEIRDNAIVQAKQSHNNRITTEQQKVLEEFAQKRELEVRI